jgi:hypothetical protein
MLYDAGMVLFAFHFTAFAPKIVQVLPAYLSLSLITAGIGCA